jgi:hypothetical protein
VLTWVRIDQAGHVLTWLRIDRQDLC